MIPVTSNLNPTLSQGAVHRFLGDTSIVNAHMAPQFLTFPYSSPKSSTKFTHFRSSRVCFCVRACSHMRAHARTRLCVCKPLCAFALSDDCEVILDTTDRNRYHQPSFYVNIFIRVSKHPKLAMSPLTCRSSVISLLFFLASCWLYGLREWNCFHLNAALFSRPRQLH